MCFRIYFERPVIYTLSSCPLSLCFPFIHTRSCLSRNSLSAWRISKSFKHIVETTLPVSFMKWIPLLMSKIRIIPKLVQTIPPVFGFILDRLQVMVTSPVFFLFTIWCLSVLTSWVTTLAFFKAQNLISNNVPSNLPVFSRYTVSKISPFSVIRIHFARGQEDNSKSRVLYICTWKESSLYWLISRKKNNIIINL